MVAQQVEPGLDMNVGWIKVGCTLVRVQGVTRLVVARFVQSAKIIPDLGDVRVETDGSAVGVEGIAVLVDLVVEDTDRAPEGRIPAVTVHGLLICLVCLAKLLLGHVAATKQVPALRVALV